MHGAIGAGADGADALLQSLQAAMTAGTRRRASAWATSGAHACWAVGGESSEGCALILKLAMR